MKKVILKQRLSGIVGMLFGGLFLAWFGFTCATMIIEFSGSKSIAIIPGIFSILGIRWVVTAAAMLTNRSRLSIYISSDGIELPAGTAFRSNAPKQVIPLSDILEVRKHVFRRGRGIKIVKTDNTTTFIDIRRYCEIDRFLELWSKRVVVTAHEACKDNPIDADAIREDSNESGRGIPAS